MYTLKAIIRYLRFHLGRSSLRYREYTHESMTRWYRGWWETAEGRCVVFVRDDGSIQYRW